MTTKSLSEDLILTSIRSRIDGFNIPTRKKELIKQYFIDDVANYLIMLMELNIRIEKLSEHSQNEQDVLNKATFNVVQAGHELECVIANKRAITATKELFREMVYPWQSESIIMKRALDKPRGYPGDYMMLEYIYGNKPVSKGIGYYLDNGFLNSQLTNAVRNRKTKMSGLLGDELYGRKNVKVLNLASGSCRELRELNVGALDNATITCVDFDDEALNYSKKMINSVNVAFLKEDIVEIAKNGKISVVEDKDLVYSIGLIDYFPDRLLIKLVGAILQNLKSGGKVILTIKDRDRYNPVQEDWLADWKFVPRNENSIVAIIERTNISDIKTTFSRDKSGIIIFLEIVKK